MIEPRGTHGDGAEARSLVRYREGVCDRASPTERRAAVPANAAAASASATLAQRMISAAITAAAAARPVVVPAPGNFYVNLPPLFLGHFSPIFPRFFPIFSPFSS